MFWDGPGGNGKDVLKSLLENAFGAKGKRNCGFTGEMPNDYITTEATGGSGDAPTAALAGLMTSKCRIVFVNEPLKVPDKKNKGDGYRLAVTKVKYTTGGGKVAYRALYKDMATGIPALNVITQCNGIPDYQDAMKSKEGGDALDRRIITLPMRFSFKTKQKMEIAIARDGDDTRWSPENPNGKYKLADMVYDNAFKQKRFYSEFMAAASGGRPLTRTFARAVRGTTRQ